MNYLLEQFPEEYEEYLIRTDYTVGLNIIACLSDEEFTVQERENHALYLLYGKGIPEDYEIALNGLKWFLNCGKQSKPQAEYQEPSFDFEKDSNYIRTAFIRTYGIDLHKSSMHWFDFIDRMSDLEKCTFTSIIDIRTTDTSNMDAKTRSKYNKLREEYAIKPLEEQLEDNEKEILEQFMKTIGKK